MAPYSFAVLMAKPSTPTNILSNRRGLLQYVLSDSASRISLYSRQIHYTRMHASLDHSALRPACLKNVKID
jgi:hypothetical protein